MAASSRTSTSPPSRVVFGLKSFRIEEPDACAATLRKALAAPGPVLVEAVVDPHEPPMPPNVTAHDAAMSAKALACGTPHAGKIALTTVSNSIRELI